MNKKTLLLSMAVLFAFSGINMAYADEAKVDVLPIKTNVETQTIQQVKDFPQFKAHHGFHKKHFEGNRPSPEEIQAKKVEFEKRLKLTDEQKAQIELQKQQDREKIKPIIDELITKKNEFKTVISDDSLSQAEKEKKLGEIKKDLKELKLQADTLRKENMTNFENLLTEKQKKEFSKIKEEQKKEMEKRRKAFEKQRKHR